ncbi:MAG: GNAT family N-acetyltransferase [Pyrinomonadaceae bacterium]
MSEISTEQMADTHGYAHRAYADSLSEFGTPLHLPLSDGWLLERSIPGYDVHDAMGAYPLFLCRDWNALAADIEELKRRLVSITLVTDPFADNARLLSNCFPDVMIAFKEHFVIDLNQPMEEFVDQHHRRNTRRALVNVQVQKCDHPIDFLNDWLTLYAELISRHNIKGIAAFSPTSFAKQLAIPGVVAFRAVHNGTVVGMVLWYEHDNRAYYHLGAYTKSGYALRASFALFDSSIRYFIKQGHCRFLSLGSGAGVDEDHSSGLSRFKKGWSNGMRPVYLCGRIFDRVKYEEIATAKRVGATRYFPAYRVGEFGESI